MAKFYVRFRIEINGRGNVDFNNGDMFVEVNRLTQDAINQIKDNILTQYTHKPYNYCVFIENLIELDD